MRGTVRATFLIACLVAVGGGFYTVYADRFSSTSYVIDASVMNTAGGSSSSSSYKLVGSSGESIIGNGASGSYKMGAGFVSQLENSLQLNVQPSGLTGHYPLDEAGSQVYDNSSNVIDGAITASPSSVAGKIGNALSLNGSTQYAKPGTTSSFTGTAFTLQAWIKTSNNAATMAAVSKGSNFWLGINFGKAAIYDWTAGSTCQASSAPSLGDNAWHHIAATLTSGATNGSIIYIDGVQQQTCTWTPVAQNGEVGIGASKAASWQQFFTGAIDEVKVYSRVLSPEEVKAEYTGQNNGTSSGVFAGTVVPGVSTVGTYDAIVRTDTANYSLAINQNQNLTNGGNSIAPISGSIASPASWVEGTTKGLGFTLFGTNATAIDGKWNGGSSYAALPGGATTIYSRTGLGGGTPDVLNMRLRLDTPATQVPADYTNVITVTGTITP